MNGYAYDRPNKALARARPKNPKSKTRKYRGYRVRRNFFNIFGDAVGCGWEMLDPRNPFPEFFVSAVRLLEDNTVFFTAASTSRCGHYSAVPTIDSFPLARPAPNPM